MASAQSISCNPDELLYTSRSRIKNNSTTTGLPLSSLKIYSNTANPAYRDMVSEVWMLMKNIAEL